MFTFYLWFVFAEHPFFFFHRRPRFFFLSCSLCFGLFSNEGPGDAPLSSVRHHPVLPLGYDPQMRPSIDLSLQNPLRGRGSSATFTVVRLKKKSKLLSRRSQQRGASCLGLPNNHNLRRETLRIRGFVDVWLGFGSITSVPTATCSVQWLERMDGRMNEGPMDGQLFAHAVPSKFALG
jgi:hypothetical protein